MSRSVTAPKERTLAEMSIMVALIVVGCRQVPPDHDSTITPETNGSLQSGVYGFSGAGTPLGTPEGVIGECVWIFDASNREQVAKGDCAEKDPGSFRIALKPGHYVLHGPGGNHPFHVQAGRWVKVESVASLPIAP
jgi:hypothetical protein